MTASTAVHDGKQRLLSKTGVCTLVYDYTDRNTTLVQPLYAKTPSPSLVYTP